MVRMVLMVALLGGTVAAGAPRLKDRPEPPEVPEGRWAVEKLEQNGFVRDAAAMAGHILVHTKTTSTLESFGRVVATEQIAFGRAGGVRHMDFTGELFVGVKRAIWKLEGDTLFICESAPDGERPTEYAAPRGSGRTLWVLKRIKE